MCWCPLFTKHDQGRWPPKTPEVVSERMCVGDSVSWMLLKVEPVCRLGLGRPETAKNS